MLLGEDTSIRTNPSDEFGRYHQFISEFLACCSVVLVGYEPGDVVWALQSTPFLADFLLCENTLCFSVEQTTYCYVTLTSSTIGRALFDVIRDRWATDFGINCFSSE
jgi:hypothetical protein